jgi:hypothetical protein
VNGFWAVFWLALIMKIPIVMLLTLVWYAIRKPPVAETEQDGEGGSRHGPHPRFQPPNPPRRGPHADPAPAPPERVRVTHRGPRVPTER